VFLGYILHNTNYGITVIAIKESKRKETKRKEKERKRK